MGRPGRDRLVLGQCAALLQAFGRQCARRQRAAWRRRPLGRFRSGLPESPVTGFHRSRTPGGIAAYPGFQWRIPGRRGLVPDHHAQWFTQLGGRGLPQAGTIAEKPEGADRRSGIARSFRRRPRQRRGLLGWRQAICRRREPRSGDLRRHVEFTTAVDVVGHRPGRAFARARHRSSRGPARRWWQPAGPPRHLHHATLHAAGHLRQDQRCTDRARVLPAQERPGNQQHCRDWRLPALAFCRRFTRRHPVPLRAGATRRPWPQPTARFRLHGTRLLPAPAQPRPPAPGQQQPCRQGGD